MIRSMTGFGRGKILHEGIEFSVEIRAVNHRYCDISVRIPKHLTFLEDKARKFVSKHVSRGKIEVYITLEEYVQGAKNVVVDESLAAGYVDALRCLNEKFSLKDDISVSLVSRFPEILKVQKDEQDEKRMWEALSKSLQQAVESLIKMREFEGNGMKKDLLLKAAKIESFVTLIDKRAQLIPKEYKQKLENRLKELLEQQVVDENRLATEVVVFADRACIDEELVRLRSHVEQFREFINESGPVGRKIDFLIQEMNREVNTVGAKANDITLSKSVVEIKSEIEKIREQIQNIE